MPVWNFSTMRQHVLICNGASCLRNQGNEVTLAIRAEIAAQGAEQSFHTTRTLCNGRCENSCVVIIYPEATWYKNITPDLGRAIVQEHLIQGKPLEDYLLIRL